MAVLPAGCNRHQSTLSTFGVEARDIRDIAIVLTIGAVLVFAGVAAIYWRAVRAPEHSIDHEGGMRMVLWLGGIGPAILLGALLLYALPAMRPRPVAANDLVIAVEGEQFWWRVAYRPPGGGEPVISANEIRLPVGRTVSFQLTAKDVVHSFWIPGLAGKMDMIPGRTTLLPVRAEKPGRYRGVCAEFCGLSHALMAFDVIAMPAAEFDAWLARSRAPREGDSEGARLFAAHGCDACHGSSAIGPTLADFGERTSLGAGILPPTIANTAAFIRAPQAAKPGARMPAYPQLSDADARAIARHLGARP
ncbi:MAG: cytochrome c oxidase subunit II [Sphingobium sp.]